MESSADTSESLSSALSENRRDSWILRTIVSFGLGIVVLIAWSASASAVEGSTLPVVDAGPSVPTAEVPGADVVEPVPEVVTLPAVAPVTVDPATASTAPVPVPTDVASVTRSVPAPALIAIPDLASAPDPIDPSILPILDPVVQPLPTGAGSPISVPSTTVDGPSSSTPAETSATTGTFDSAASGTEITATDTQPSASFPSDSPADGRSQTPGAPRLPAPSPPAPCGAGSALNPTTSSTASIAVTRASEGTDSRHATATVSDRQGAYSSIARARPDVAPD